MINPELEFLIQEVPSYASWSGLSDSFVIAYTP